MMCQSCNENLATVHLTEIVQKAKKETHLCEECARDKGVSYGTQFSVKDFLSGLAKSKAAATPFIASSKPEPGAAPAAEESPAAEEQEPCPSCGISFAEFRRSGRLGCFNDYEHFQEGLVPLLEKIHGQKQHTGRVPDRVGERIKRQRQITDHRTLLQEAVEREDYEAAAELRDQIRALESEGA